MVAHVVAFLSPSHDLSGNSKLWREDGTAHASPSRLAKIPTKGQDLIHLACIFIEPPTRCQRQAGNQR